ncbi:hypothetical protein [Prevotellamassilia timonensis]|uniref:hypothetical protein n=1 Tax=Prevotellamassilia timonensis TaxID=1852370 RepID=UPI00307A8CBD
MFIFFLQRYGFNHYRATNWGLKEPNGHPLSRSVSVSKAPLNSSPMMRAMWLFSTSMLMYHDLLNHGLRFHENSPWGLC